MLKKIWRWFKAWRARRLVHRSRQYLLKKSGRLSSIRKLLPKDNHQRRKFVLACLQRYHDRLGSELMDNVYLYLEEELTNPEEASKIYSVAREDLNFAMHEYSYSLNAVAECANIIFDNETISDVQIIEGLNLILYAYSCNFDEKDFLNKESKAMEVLLSGL